MATVSVRYIVDNVDEAIAFYCGLLDFQEVMHPVPAFAMLARGDLRLVLSAPGAGPGGGQAMPNGQMPKPGGWNRFSLEVADLAATVEQLRIKGARFRNDIVTGVEESRFCSKTLPGILSSCSSRPCPRRASRVPDRPLPSSRPRPGNPTFAGSGGFKAITRRA